MNLIELLLSGAGLAPSSAAPGLRVLDVGCGLGGTSRYLARTLGCSVTGVTISTKQVEMATRLSRAEADKDANDKTKAADGDDGGFVPIGQGKVRFLELDAETMGAEFGAGKPGREADFDVVWISEALSHIPGKEAFFRNAFAVLKQGGTLVIADWFKGEGLEEGNADIKNIEGELFFPTTHPRETGREKKKKTLVASWEC